jgi:hypothetical protein
MSEWRQRGYVLDSDDEEIVLDIAGDCHNTNTGNNAGDDITITTRSPSRDGQRYASEELFDNAGDTGRSGLTRRKSKYWEPTTSSAQPSQEEARQDTTFDIPEDKTQDTSPKLTVQYPIVLITQTRRAASPPEINKNARTYSRKFRPGALKRIKSTVNTIGHVEQEAEEDDGFMDIDALVGGSLESEQAPPSSAPLFAPSQTERRLSVSSSDLSDVDMDLISSPQHVQRERTTRYRDFLVSLRPPLCKVPLTLSRTRISLPSPLNNLDAICEHERLFSCIHTSSTLNTIAAPSRPVV